MSVVDPNSIPFTWLVEKLESTLFEFVLRHDLERAQLINVDIEKMIQEAIPKGKEKWSQFIADMIENDELWFFSNSKNDWASLSGRSGYAIVRDGKIIGAEITVKS